MPLAGIWFVVAYIRFREALADTGVAPEYGIWESLRTVTYPKPDSIELPGIGPAGGFQRQATLRRLTWTPSEHPAVERQRRLVTRRALIAVCTALGGTPALMMTGALLDFLRTAASRLAGAGDALLVVVATLTAAVLVWVAVPVVRYGRGAPVGDIEFLLRVFSVPVAWLLIAGATLFAFSVAR